MTDNRTTELLPCPWCGGEAQMGVNKESTVREYFVGCMNCHIRLYKIGYKRFWSEAEAIAAWNTRAELGSEINGETSDGYHTFNELYHHRAVLFSVIVRDHRELAWKAMKHHDGTMYDGMFIVGIETPKGQATYHYDLDPYWEMFDCEEREYAPEWDGHTPDEAIARIAELGSGTCEIEHVKSGALYDVWRYSCCGYEHAESVSEESIPQNFCPNCGRKVVNGC